MKKGKIKKSGSHKKNKWKFDEEKPFELLGYLLKFIFLFWLSLIIFTGWKLFGEMGDASKFQSWVLLLLISCGLVFIFWKTFTWRTTYPFGHMAHVFLLVAIITNESKFFKWALGLFAFAIIYDLLKMFGLRLKVKTYWRNKES